MKVVAKVDFNINGQHIEQKHEIIANTNSHGKVEIKAKGTDEKIKIVVTGKVNGKEIDIKAYKKIGEKKEIKIKKCPSAAKSEVKKGIKKMIKEWKKLVA